MGTRSLTHIYEKSESAEPFVTIYRQYDGYPEGIGEDIKAALGSRKLVNGFQDPKTQCNGMHCAAALLVSALKKNECGNVYLYAAGTKDAGQDYTYHLFPDGHGFRLMIEDGIYDGPLSDFDSAKLQEPAND